MTQARLAGHPAPQAPKFAVDERPQLLGFVARQVRRQPAMQLP